jgi:hypothetical protein
MATITMNDDTLVDVDDARFLCFQRRYYLMAIIADSNE